MTQSCNRYLEKTRKRSNDRWSYVIITEIILLNSSEIIRQGIMSVENYQWHACQQIEHFVNINTLMRPFVKGPLRQMSWSFCLAWYLSELDFIIHFTLNPTAHGCLLARRPFPLLFFSSFVSLAFYSTVISMSDDVNFILL